MYYRILNKEYTETYFMCEILNWQNKWVKVEFIRCVDTEGEISWYRKGESSPDGNNEQEALEEQYQNFIRTEKLERILK